MQISKRVTVRAVLAASVVASFSLGGQAIAQAVAWPQRPVKIFVPYPPGGFTDVVTRRLAAKLSIELGQPFVVENKPGAGTNIAAEAVAKAQADGYTLLMGTSSLAINHTLYKKLGYDVERDLAPLGAFATTGYTLLAGNKVAANSVSELQALARQQSQPMTFGSSGNGAVNHLAGEVFESMANVKLQHVPYRGSQAAITDLIGGQIDLFWASNLEAMPFVKERRVKALGVTTSGEVPALPGVPAIGKTIKGYEVVFWMGLFAPRNTSTEIVERLGVALKKAATTQEMREFLLASGAEAVYRNSSETAALVRRDVVAWGRAVERSGATVE